MTRNDELLRAQTEELLAYLNHESGVAMLLLDETRTILGCNAGFCRIFNLPQEPEGRPLSDFLWLGEGTSLEPGSELKLQCNPQTGIHGIFLGHAIPGPHGWTLFCEQLILTEADIVKKLSVLHNELVNKEREITRKNLALSALHDELSRKVAEQEAALAQVKLLEGILPICMYCKKIRNDQKYWEQLELYISTHSQAMFSHCICPDCFRQHFPEYAVEKTAGANGAGH